MTNTNNTKNTRKAKKGFIASLCAVIAATAVITGITVFSASAENIGNAPAQQTVTVSAQQETKAESETFKGGFGFNYQAVVDNYNASEAEDAVPAGIFVDVKQPEITMSITKPDAETCECTVTIPDGKNGAAIYSFKGSEKDSKIVYSAGTKTVVTYGDNGEAAKTEVAGGTHQGSIEKTSAGYEWKDNDTTAAVFA